MQEVGARAAEMEAAATKLAGELAEYKSESKELRNQEHTIRKLEERARALEAQLDEKAREASPGSCILLLSNLQKHLDRHTLGQAPMCAH